MGEHDPRNPQVGELTRTNPSTTQSFNLKECMENIARLGEQDCVVKLEVGAELYKRMKLIATFQPRPLFDFGAGLSGVPVVMSGDIHPSKWKATYRSGKIEEGATP